jgi:dihydropteroate synthase
MLNLEHLAHLWHQHPQAASARVNEFSLGPHAFPFNSRPAIVGVINLSPDSWYRESVCLTAEQAARRGRVLHAQGADIIDLGAESSLAHAARSGADQQTARLVPVIETLANEGLVVSAETYDPEVAERCLKAGAGVLNLTGTEHTAEIYRLAARHDAAVIICHVQGPNVREVGDFDFGRDPIDMLQGFFAEQTKLAASCGLKKIIIDPGLGFYYRNLEDSARRVRYQTETFLNTFRLRALGHPVCHALPHAFEYFGEEVRSAEPFFAVLAALGKTDLFRTHEVARVKAVLDTMLAAGEME